MLAYDFPLFSMFLTLFGFAIAVMVVVTVIYAFIDNFRRPDHHGWAKAGWALFIVVVPLIGTIVYIAARPADPFAEA